MLRGWSRGGPAASAGAAAAVGGQFDPEFVAAVCRLDSSRSSNRHRRRPAPLVGTPGLTKSTPSCTTASRRPCCPEVDGVAPPSSTHGSPICWRSAPMVRRNRSRAGSALPARRVDRRTKAAVRTAYAAGRLALVDHARTRRSPSSSPRAPQTEFRPRRQRVPHDAGRGVPPHRPVPRRHSGVSNRALARRPAASSGRHPAPHRPVHDSTWSTSEQLAVLEQGLSDSASRCPGTGPAAGSRCAISSSVPGRRHRAGVRHGARRAPERYRLLALSTTPPRSPTPAICAAKRRWFVLRQAYLGEPAGPVRRWAAPRWRWPTSPDRSDCICWPTVASRSRYASPPGSATRSG